MVLTILDLKERNWFRTPLGFNGSTQYHQRIQLARPTRFCCVSVFVFNFFPEPAEPAMEQNTYAIQIHSNGDADVSRMALKLRGTGALKSVTRAVEAEN